MLLVFNVILRKIQVVGNMETVQVQTNVHVKLVGREYNVTSAFQLQAAFMENVLMKLLGARAIILQNGLDPFVIFVSIEYILAIPNLFDYVFISLFCTIITPFLFQPFVRMAVYMVFAINQEYASKIKRLNYLGNACVLSLSILKFSCLYKSKNYRSLFSRVFSHIHLSQVS